MSTNWPGGSRVRASDAEREQVATIVRAAVSDGRLSLADGDERLAQVYHAVYRDELHPLTADLPDGGWDTLTRTPEARAEVRRGLRRHAYAAALVAGVLIAAWLLSGAHFFWPVIPLVFVWLGLARHLRYARYGAPWGRWYHPASAGPAGGPWGGPWGPGWRGPGWGPGWRYPGPHAAAPHPSDPAGSAPPASDPAPPGSTAPSR